MDTGPSVGFVVAAVRRTPPRASAQDRLLPNQASLSRDLWSRAVRPGDTVIDATCGRGKDTLSLARLVGGTGSVFAVDVQESAIAQTRERIEAEVPPDKRPAVHYVLGSHAGFPASIEPGSVSAIVYNLGYLPGEGVERSIVTRRDSTIQSLENGLPLVRVGGLITLTTYVQQDGGAEEEQAILDLTGGLDAKLWTVNLLQWINRDSAPSIVAIERLR